MLSFDQRATLALNGLYTPFTDGAWKLLSGPAVWVVGCSLLIAYLFVRLGWKKALVAVGACLLTFALADRTSVFVKEAVARLRPCWDEDMLAAGLRVLEGKGGRYGFFSAHAANAAGLALCSFLCLRSDRSPSRRGYAFLAFGLATLVGISRIFVGKHYLVDVLTGFAAGLLLGWLSAAIGRWFIGRMQAPPARSERTQRDGESA
mgnify:CR=1 FL=1